MRPTGPHAVPLAGSCPAPPSSSLSYCPHSTLQLEGAQKHYSKWLPGKGYWQGRAHKGGRAWPSCFSHPCEKHRKPRNELVIQLKTRGLHANVGTPNPTARLQPAQPVCPHSFAFVLQQTLHSPLLPAVAVLQHSPEPSSSK